MIYNIAIDTLLKSYWKVCGYGNCTHRAFIDADDLVSALTDFQKVMIAIKQ